MSTPTAMTTHHDVPLHQELLVLQSDLESGLSEQDGAARLQAYGPNTIPAVPPESALVRFLRQFRSPLVYVLLGAIALSLAVGQLVDAAVITGVVLANALIGFVQEDRAVTALGELQHLIPARTRVLRGATWREIPSQGLVPGDIVAIAAGDRVSADTRVIRCRELRIDESALTGEAEPVAKAALTLPSPTALADRVNMAYSGTLVVAGTGTGLVVETGLRTELGAIHQLAAGAPDLGTPLTRRIASFSRGLTIAILGLAALTFGLGLMRGETAPDMVMASVALAVGAIPEGLPAAVTITLAIGVSRMARRGAILRRLPAAETLGSATVICTDKTGTLTRNEMAVVGVYSSQRLHHASDAGLPSARDCLVAGALCTDARSGPDGIVGEATERAMLVLAEQHGYHQHALLQQFPILDTVPFDSGRGWMATMHEAQGQHVVYVKGALEKVLPMCGGERGADGVRRPLDLHSAERVADDFGRHGLRVIALASGPPEGLQGGTGQHLTFLGLQAMADPLRPASAAAVAACRHAGIRIVMITGDHPATAQAIAREAGIGHDGNPVVMTGIALREGDSALRGSAVQQVDVFARTSAEDKMLIVQLLQEAGEVVAMTGDGVNDAPPLARADIGIAMGQSGTEAARESADMILADDNFATIEAAVEEGRAVYANLVKFISWTLPTNLGEGLLVLTAIVWGSTLPMTPVQILWVNMTTAVALGLTLAFEPREPGIMDRPPRDPAGALLPAPLIARITMVGLLILAGCFVAFHATIAMGASLEQARTCAVNALVAMEIAYLITCRSLDIPLHRLAAWGNRVLLLGVAVTVLLQAAFTFLPFMQAAFQTEAPTGTSWLIVLAMGVGMLAVVVATDALRRRLPAARKPSPSSRRGSARRGQGGAAGNPGAPSADPSGSALP